MKKFIKNYWWLIAIAAFLWWRKRNQEPCAVRTEEYGSIQSYVGHKVRLNVTDEMHGFLADGRKGVELIVSKPKAECPYLCIHDGETFTIDKIVENQNERLAGNGWASEPFTRYDVYLPDGSYFPVADYDFGKCVFFTIVD